MSCWAANAQTSTGDRLYAQGVSYMKTLTIAMQNKALAAFGKAKVAYDSKVKKDLCDEQIATCRNIIRKLSVQASSEQQPIAPKDTVTTEIDVAPISIPKVDVILSVNPTIIEFAAKGGKYLEVTVDCNAEEWKVVSSPEWVSYTSASDKLLIKAERNKEKSERAGVVTLRCQDKEAEIIVKQAKANFLNKLGL